MNRLMAFGCAVLAFAGLAAFGETYTWKGGDGAFDAAENWTTSGGGHAVPSGTTSDLAFPLGGTVSGVGSLTVNNISLGAAVDLQFGTGGGTFTVNGVISGSGSLKSTGNAAANCTTVLKGDNTFSGGYTNYGGQTKVCHANALGKGSAFFLSNGKPQYCLAAGASVTVPNDMTIGQAVGWFGPITATGYTLTLAGTIHFVNQDCRASGSASSCVRFSGGTTVFKGDVYLDYTANTGFVANGNVVFEKPVRSKAGASNTFGIQFDGSTPTFTFNGTGNAIGNIWWNTSATLVMAATNAFPAASRLYANTTSSVAMYINLGGKDQVVASVDDNGKAISDPSQFRVYSANPATITMKASASRTFSGAFNDAVTLCWNPSASTSTYTIQQATSTTTGGLIVSNGTVNVGNGAQMPNLTSITVAPGAHLAFESGSACNTLLDRMVIGGTDTTSFTVADGVTIEVTDLYTVDEVGRLVKQAANSTFTSAEIPSLGEGVTLKTGLESVTYVGANGGDWNVGANWSGQAVPTSGSRVTIPDGISSIVISGDAPVAGLTAPPATALTLSGDGKLILGQPETVVANEKDLTIACEISGAGKLVSRGAGVLKLSHANTYTGGTLRDRDSVSANGKEYAGRITIADNGALGTGKVEFNCHSGLTTASTVTTVANAIAWDSIYSSSPSFYNHLMYNGSVTFAGKLDFSKTRCARVCAASPSVPPSTITYGEVVLETTTSTGWDHSLIPKSGTHVFTGKVSGSGTIECDTYSHWRFRNASNELYALSFYGKTTGSMLDSEAKDTFVDTTRIMFYTGAGATAQGWNLNGHDQTVESAYDAGGADSSTHLHYITSPEPATLTMRATANRTYTGLYKDALSVCWNPTGNYTFTLSGGRHTTSGALIVSNGTVSVAGGAELPTLSEIDLAAGAAFTCAAGTTVNPGLHKLVLAKGATLEAPAGTVFDVDEFWIVDEQGVATLQDPDLTFTSADFSGLKGVSVHTAHHEVPSVDVTWTAGGGADTKFATADNWSSVPDLTGYATVATFANAGSVATTTDDVNLKGIVFGAASGFTIGGTGAISLYETGLAATGSATYEIAAPLVVRVSSPWTVGEGAKVKITGVFGGCEDTPDRYVNVVTGKGSVEWRAAAGSTHAGMMVFSNQYNDVYGEGFGSSDKGTLVFTDIPQGSSHVTFHNVTVNRAVELIPEGILHDNYGSGDFFVTPSATTNVFNGPISLRDNYVRFQCGSGSRCVFAGGVYSKTSHYPVPLGAGWYVITNTPLNVSSWWSDTTGHTIFAVPGNRFTSSIRLGNASASGVTSEIRLETDNAVAQCPELFLSSSSRVDLNGHDLCVSRLNHGNAACSPEVTSATPATLYATNFTGNPTSHPVRFTGAASFVKGGNTTFTLTGVSTSTGSVEVIGGALAFGENASWRGASRVNVAKWTRMELSNPKTFGRKTDLYLNSGTADNVGFKLMKQGRFVVHDLYIDGAKQATGTWGAEGSKDENGKPPEHTHPLFLGGGVLFVRGDSGLTVIIR